MTFAEYQAGVMRTASGMNYEKYGALMNAALGITGEGGEVADLIKKATFQGHSLDCEHLIEELGDCLYYIALAADGLGTTLESIAEYNNAKHKKRYPNGFEVDRSINREKNNGADKGREK